MNSYVVVLQVIHLAWGETKEKKTQFPSILTVQCINKVWSLPGVSSEGADSVAEAESSVFEGLSRYVLSTSVLYKMGTWKSFFACHSHVRTVVATLGGQHGAAIRHDKWRHLHAGFSVWLSKSEARGKIPPRLSFFCLSWTSVSTFLVSRIWLHAE